MPVNRMRPIHPGEVLREEYLVPLSMSTQSLAESLRLPAHSLAEVLEERRGLSPDTALRLARFFGTTAQFWLNLQSSYDLKVTELSIGRRIEQEIRPLQAVHHT